MKYITILSLSFAFISCLKNDSSESTSKQNISKVITTKAFTAKQEFDNLVEDKPALTMGYDRTLGMDFTWNTKHLDKFGNIIYQEDLNLNDKGEQEVYRKITKEYFDPEQRKLSRIFDESKIYGKTEEKYVRNDQGQLQEILKTRNEKLDEKTVYTYNEVGQRTKRELFKEAGIYEINLYIYDSPSLTDGNVKQETHKVFGDDGYTEELEYERTKDNKILKLRRKYFENEKLQSDVTTSYTAFIKDFPTMEVREGYDSPTTYTDGTVIQSEPYRMTTKYALNDNGDIIEYKSIVERLTKAEKRSVFDFDLITIYKCDYTYNENKDWIKLIFSPEPKIKYIISRDIKYLD